MTPREELIAAMDADGAETPVEVPGVAKRWGRVFVRPRSVEEIVRRDKEVDIGDIPLGRVYAIAAARIMCDENGKRLFDPDNESDIARLMRRRDSDLQKIVLAGADEGN